MMSQASYEWPCPEHELTKLSGWVIGGWVRETKVGSTYGKLLLYALGTHASSHGVAFPSQEALADDIEASTKTVQRHLAEMTDAGLIFRASYYVEGKRAGTRYVLLCNVPGEFLTAEQRALKAAGFAKMRGRLDSELPDSESGSSPDLPDSCADLPDSNGPLHDSGVLRNKPLINKPPKNNTPPTPPADAFHAWWSAYPRKVDRKRAEKAYAAALRRGASHEGLMAGLRWYAAQCKRDGTELTFVKHPTTWLNSDCWEDGAEHARAAAAELAMWHAAMRRLGWGTRASTASWFEDPTGVTDSIQRQYHRKFGVYPENDPTLVEAAGAAPTPKLPAVVVDVPDDDGYVSDGDRRTLPDGRRQRYDEGADLWVAEHEWQPV